MYKYGLLVLFMIQQVVMAAEVNLYSARKQALIKPLLEQFTHNTGIRVNLVTGKADTLIKRLEIEGKNTPADMLLTVDAARLMRAKDLGLFQAVESDSVNETIPSQYRDADNHWFGLSLRSRVIVYASDRVSPESLASYEQLAESQWKNRICVRSSSNIYNQSLVASLIAHKGVQMTEAWAAALVNNFARNPKGGDRDQIKAVVAGVCDIALVNTYYLAGMLNSNQPAEAEIARQVSLFWPNQQGRGAHMNVSGVGILKYARHVNEARQLLEYLISDEAQKWYNDTNYEFPVKVDIDSRDILSNWGDFKQDGLNLSELGKHNAAAVLLMDRAGWK